MTLMDTTPPLRRPSPRFCAPSPSREFTSWRATRASLAHGRRKDEFVSHIADTGRIRFRDLFAQLRREELRTACRENALSDAGRAHQAPFMRRWVT
jgi:hypothetical protein